MKASEIRIGNLLEWENAGEKFICQVLTISKTSIRVKVFGNDLEDTLADINQLSGLSFTEEAVMKLRNEQGYRLFRKEPPGERQIENNFYAEIFNEDRRVHLSPSYRYELQDDKKTRIKNPVPEFWFNWIEAWGTGSDWFLSMIPIHGKRPLKYLHQFQNFWFELTGEELTIKPI